MFIMLAISILVIGYSSSVFASDDDKVELPGFISIILMLLRAIIALVLITISFIIGLLIGGQAAAITIETFIFNQYELTSLNVFTGSKVDATANALYENVAKWFVILFGVAIVVEILVLIYIAINSVLRTLKQDPKKEAETKKMIKDYLLGLLVLFGMGIFIIAIILLNNTIVSAFYKEAVAGAWDDSLTMELWKGIFNTNVLIGTQSLILYIIISAMGLVFFLYYFKRLLKVSFLIVISPLVAVTYAVNRRSGSAKSLLAWSKMFVYTVLIQVIHALTYVSFISIIVEAAGSKGTAAIPAMILLVSGLKFLWDSETIIGSLFGISADKVQGNTALLLGMLSQANKFKKVGSNFVKKAPILKTIDKAESKKKIPLKTQTSENINKKDNKILDSSKEDLKDKIKDKEKDKKEEDKQKEGKKKLTEKDILEKEKKQAKRRENLEKIYDKRPLKGLGTSMKEYTITKAKNLNKQTFKRMGKKIGKTALKTTVAGITATASHATPQVGMVEAGTMGYKGADWAIKNVETKRNKMKHKKGCTPYSKSVYEKNLNNEAEQFKAIRTRKDKLGEEVSSNSSEKEEKTSAEELDNQNVAFQQEFKTDFLEEYASTIGSTSREKLEASYKNTKKEAIAEFQTKTGKSEFEAKEHVAKLQNDILNKRDFDYDVLSDIDRTLMHKYLDLITKDKIDDFEKNTTVAGEKIRYKEVVKRSRKL